MLRMEMIFEYSATGYAELEEMETIFRVVYGIEYQVEHHEDYMILVWYE